MKKTQNNEREPSSIGIEYKIIPLFASCFSLKDLASDSLKNHANETLSSTSCYFKVLENSLVCIYKNKTLETMLIPL
jgi:hypothetical protein